MLKANIPIDFFLEIYKQISEYIRHSKNLQMNIIIYLNWRNGPITNTIKAKAISAEFFELSTKSPVVQFSNCMTNLVIQETVKPVISPSHKHHTQIKGSQMSIQVIKVLQTPSNILVNMSHKKV